MHLLNFLEEVPLNGGKIDFCWPISFWKFSELSSVTVLVFSLFVYFYMYDFVFLIPDVICIWKWSVVISCLGLVKNLAVPRILLWFSAVRLPCEPARTSDRSLVRGALATTCDA